MLGYSTNGHAYRIYNLRTHVVIESVNVIFDDLANLQSKTCEDLGFDLIDNTPPSTDIEVNHPTPTPTSPTNEDFHPGHMSDLGVEEDTPNPETALESPDSFDQDVPTSTSTSTDLETKQIAHVTSERFFDPSSSSKIPSSRV